MKMSYYTCRISDDLVFEMYMDENKCVQSYNINLADVTSQFSIAAFTESLTDTEWKTLLAISRLTTGIGCRIPEANVITAVYRDAGGDVANTAIEKQIRNLRNKVGENPRFRVKQGHVLSNIEKQLIKDESEDDDCKKQDGKAIIKETGKTPANVNTVTETQTQTDSEQSDAYYMSRIKERAAFFTGENKVEEVRALEILSINRNRLKLQESKDEIDIYFANDCDFYMELIERGVSEQIADWYCTLFGLYVLRRQHQEDLKEAEEKRDAEKITMDKNLLYRDNHRINYYDEKIKSYVQDSEKVGKREI